MQELLQLDQELFLYLNGLGTPSWDGFWLFMTNKWSSIPLYVVLLLLSYRLLGIRKLLVLLVFVALTILVTDQTANMFKYGIMRPRPCHEPLIQDLLRLVKGSCGGPFGYFSAHAANSFAVAVLFSGLLGKTFRWLPVFLLLWAAVVAYSRIYVGVHYPGDVLTGLLVGSLYGWIFLKLYRLSILKYVDNR